MTTTSFIAKLTDTLERTNSLLCVGLDPNPHRYPDHFPDFARNPTLSLTRWARTIVEQTADLVCCYKPNFAFYEQFGLAGVTALKPTIAALPSHSPLRVEAKRGDIGHTAQAYAEAAFRTWGADAVTVNPYLGEDGIEPFLEYSGKMVFVLCYTSNPSARQIQEHTVARVPLYEHIARHAQTWGSPEQVAFVVGATQPHALTTVRELAPDRWFLAPGVGSQGGNPTVAVAAGLDDNGLGMIMPVSRAITYAESPRAIAMGLRESFNQARRQAPQTRRSMLHHQRLIEKLYEVDCVQFGDFTLASGKQSPIYMDLRRVTADPTLLKLVAWAYADLLRPLTFDHLAGVPYAALPISTAVALTLHKPLIYPRKEAKLYGLSNTVEGRFEAGDCVAVIEDLVTSGGSVLQAIEQLEAVGLRVQDVAVLIDREQGGPTNLAAQGYRLHAALTLTEILETLHQLYYLSSEQYETVKNYLQTID